MPSEAHRKGNDWVPVGQSREHSIASADAITFALRKAPERYAQRNLDARSKAKDRRGRIHRGVHDIFKIRRE